MSGKRRKKHPECCIRSVLPEIEVSNEVCGRPPLAQGRGIRPCGPKKMGKTMTLGCCKTHAPQPSGQVCQAGTQRGSYYWLGRVASSSASPMYSVSELIGTTVGTTIGSRRHFCSTNFETLRRNCFTMR